MRGPKASPVVVLLLLCALAPAGRAGASRDILERGNALYAKGRYDEALSAYREGLLKFPGVTELHHGAGNALYRLKRFPEAEKEFSEAGRTGRSPESRYNQGDAQVRQNQLEPSLENFKQSLREHPEDPDAKYNLELIRGRLQQNQDQKQNPDKGGGKQSQKPDPSKGGEKPQPQQGDGQGKKQDKRSMKDPQELNKDQADQILKALASDEQRVQGDRLKARVSQRKPVKDW